MFSVPQAFPVSGQRADCQQPSCRRPDSLQHAAALPVRQGAARAALAAPGTHGGASDDALASALWDRATTINLHQGALLQCTARPPSADSGSQTQSVCVWCEALVLSTESRVVHRPVLSVAGRPSVREGPTLSAQVSSVTHTSKPLSLP